MTALQVEQYYVLRRKGKTHWVAIALVLGYDPEDA
jgi:hypothetical protein